MLPISHDRHLHLLRHQLPTQLILLFNWHMMLIPNTVVTSGNFFFFFVFFLLSLCFLSNRFLPNKQASMLSGREKNKQPAFDLFVYRGSLDTYFSSLHKIPQDPSSQLPWPMRQAVPSRIDFGCRHFLPKPILSLFTTTLCGGLAFALRSWLALKLDSSFSSPFLIKLLGVFRGARALLAGTLHLFQV